MAAVQWQRGILPENLPKNVLPSFTGPRRMAKQISGPAVRSIGILSDIASNGGSAVRRDDFDEGPEYVFGDWQATGSDARSSGNDASQQSRKSGRRSARHTPRANPAVVKSTRRARRTSSGNVSHPDLPQGSGGPPLYDPTSRDLLQTRDGSENPPAEIVTWFSGTRHPTLASLNSWLARPERGSLTLPCTIPLVNRDGNQPLQRSAVYGVDLTLQSRDRSTHLLTLGLTGAGKNQRVIDPLRAAAIRDPYQTVVSFSLKAADYGPVRELCRLSGKRLIVMNLGNPHRSATWNPLATSDPDEARDLIRRFSDAARNLQSHDSEFWAQWVRCGLEGCWQQGLRSFPAILHFFSQPYSDVVRQLQQHNNRASGRLADYLHGQSHNAETVMASILGALSSLLSRSALDVLSGNELDLQRVFRRPVCLHVEIPEPQLETYRPLIQMLARSIIDALISTAEHLTSDRRVPTTLFFDDMPSLGPLLSVERLLTLRSREIGIVAGVQSINSLELAYGSTSRALLEAFVHKIVLPGCAQPDADYFSHASGQCFVALPTFEGQSPTCMTRPLLSAAEIRNPEYRHPNLGRPATLFFEGAVFQAYLQQAFELPDMQSVLRASRGVTGHEKLRRRRAPSVKHTVHPAPEASANRSTRFTDTSQWGIGQLREHMKHVRLLIGWEQLTPEARQWWNLFRPDSRQRLILFVRLLEELQFRHTLMQRFFDACVASGTTDIESNLHYLDYMLAKERAESLGEDLQ